MKDALKKQLARCRKGLCLLLVLACLLPMSGPAMVMEAGAVTQAEVNALREKSKGLSQQKKDLQSQLKTIQANKSDALDKKDNLEQQVAVIQEEISNLQQQISAYEGLIGQKASELAETEAKEKEQYDLFCQRVRVMEEEGETSYWSILFGSSDFTDLLDNFMMVEEIIDYDNSIMESLLALQAQIEEEKSSLEASRAELESAKKEQEAARQELKSQEAEINKVIADIQGQEQEAQAAIKALEAAASAMDAEIRKKEKELASQIANVPSESGFLWPLSGYNTLTSLFGSRIHPITGKANNHTGIDIPAPAGTAILASKSGVVITSTRNGSYGNYVVVGHSDGTSTLYAHMSSRSVSQGQTVKQGQVVGRVGTTGSSTGNHLHFEIRVNGSRVDPVNYFKSKTLYVQSRGKKVQLKH